MVQGYQSSTGGTQSGYGGAGTAPGIDQPLSVHLPGGQGVNTAAQEVSLNIMYACFPYLTLLQFTCCSQGFGRVGGSAPANTGYDSSLGSHVPHGQNVGSASAQVHCLLWPMQLHAQLSLPDDKGLPSVQTMLCTFTHSGPFCSTGQRE